MQLVAYGAQDVHLTGQPQITFFKAVHKRHTNFSVEPIPQQLNNTASFGNTAECTIGRNGDLINRMYIRAVLQLTSTSAAAGNNMSFVKNLGWHMLNYVEIQIGGTRIDKHLSQWMEIWYQLTRDAHHSSGFLEMIGNTHNAQSFRRAAVASTAERDTLVFIPLDFWFNRNPGLALPLIALQYHEVKLLIKFADANQVYQKSGSHTVTPSFKKCDILVDYIYLDTEERKRFAQNSHEYLIDQVQDPATKSITAGSSSTSIDLHFNHPVKALYWVNPSAHVDGVSTVTLGTDAKTWIKNFVLRYACGAVTVDGILRYDTTNTRFEVGAANASGSTLNTAFSVEFGNTKITDKDFVKWLESSSVHVVINTGNTSAEYENNVVEIGNMDNFLNHPVYGYLSGLTLAQLDTAGSGATSVFSTVSTTDLGDHDVTGRVHSFGVGLGNLQSITEARLKLNGQERFEYLEAEYFNLVQPWQSHKNTPEHGVYMYSFALNPADYQPSGTCNFSRIDNAQLELKLPTNAQNNSNLSVYAHNYNVLRIMSGMGGLAYSN